MRPPHMPSRPTGNGAEGTEVMNGETGIGNMRAFWKKSALAVLLCAAMGAPVSAQESVKRPNIVVLVADDVGFSDFGAYGSEISTPNIDALAGRGTLFSNFHVSPVCAPTRAMLMTGVESHRAGIGNLPETLPEIHQGHPAYLGRLRDDVVTLASLLKEAGYKTYMAGKWHLGHEPGALPNARGFDRSFALDASGADNWEKKSYLPLYDEAPWFEDGKPATLPEDFYSSEFFVDMMITYLEEDRQEGEPFFSYIGFQAVHIPIQAPRSFIEKYEGVYAEGWDALRAARFEAVMERGLLPPGTKMGPMPEGLEDWESFTPEEQRYLAKSMAVNAGMLEAMDFHIGRLIDHLKETGDYENTIFVVMSDNGPEPNEPTEHFGFKEWLWSAGYSRDYETLGEKGSYAFIGSEFASAAAAPGAFFKLYAGEGGLRVPLIIAGEGVGQGRADAFSFVTDLTPTLLDLAGVTPAAEVDGVPVQEFAGRSLAPILKGEAQNVRGPDEAVGIELGGNAALFRGDYKLTRNMPPLGDRVWRLYNIKADPGETKDLAAQEPELFADMMREYEAYAARVGVLEVPEGYEQMKRVAALTREKRMGRLFPWAGLAVLLLAGAIGGAVYYRRRRARG